MCGNCGVKDMRNRAALLALFVCFWGFGFAQSSQGEAKQPGKKDDPTTAYKADAPISSPSASGKDTIDSHQQTADAKTQGEPKPAPYTPTEKLTVVLIVVTSVQAVIYFFQWLWMKKSLNHARKSSEQQLRAYISVDFEDPEKQERFPHNLAIGIINTGQTPALYVEGVSQWWKFDSPSLNPPTDFNYPIKEHRVASKFTLGAQKRTTILFPLVPAEDEAKTPFSDFLERANKGEITLYFYGTFHYRDVFNGTPERRADFCIRHMSGDTSKTRQAVVCRVHNEAT